MNGEERREEIELRHAEWLAGLPWSRRVSRFWSINWPAMVVIAGIVFVIIVLAVIQ